MTGIQKQTAQRLHNGDCYVVFCRKCGPAYDEPDEEEEFWGGLE